MKNTRIYATMTSLRHRKATMNPTYEMHDRHERAMVDAWLIYQNPHRLTTKRF